MEPNPPDYGKLIKESCSKTDFARKLGYRFYNGTVANKVNKIIEENSLSILHFDGGKSKKIKYPTIIKVCPVCQKQFEAKKGARKEKQTCSYSCANKHFRSGENNGMWQTAEKTGRKDYAKICFRFHKKECIICGENKIVAAHHYDHNHENNEPTNFVPLCPTHHGYVHSKFHHLVKDRIDEYVIKFKEAIKR